MAKYRVDVSEPAENDPKDKISEWRVYFDGSFWRRHGRERAGKAFPLAKQFVWGNETWQIPALYTCSRGLVVDFCAQVPPERIQSFMDKWGFLAQSDETSFNEENRMQMNVENPLGIGFNQSIIMNGVQLSASRSCGLSWNPCLPEGNSPEAMSVMQHYGLDPSYGWSICRAAFPWKSKRKPQIQTLSVSLMRAPVTMPGEHFHVSELGKPIMFTHPTTGKQHTLTIQKYEQKEINHLHFDEQDLIFPTHYTLMSYVLTPDLPDDAFSIQDCGHSDQPHQDCSDMNASQTSDGSCIAIIGGASGPTAIFIGNKGHDKFHIACSAAHFMPVDAVVWRMVFREKRGDDITIKLV